MNFDQYFKRQMVLDEIGASGQKALQEAKVLVIGCGGLGSPMAVQLAGSGIGHLHLVDFDQVSESNLHRQLFYQLDDLGKAKAEVLANRIKARSPYTQVTYEVTAVQKNTILSLIKDFDIIVDGTDSLPVKFLINDACVIAQKPLVYGSLYKFDGYVATFNFKDANGELSANLRDAFPNMDTESPNCVTAGTMNPIVGIIANLQVNEVLKLITQTGRLLINQILIYNTLENRQYRMQLSSQTAAQIPQIFETTAYHDVVCNIVGDELIISKEQFENMLSDKTVRLISLLNKKQSPKYHFHLHYNYNDFDMKVFEKENTSYTHIFVCETGHKSYDIVSKLKQSYPELTVFSLEGGMAS